MPSARWTAFASVALFTAWRLFELFADPFNLSFDEAQYWAWSKNLAFGYFSKPPLIAWIIGLTTAVGGDAEPWVRLGSTLAHAGAALALFFIGRKMFDDRVGLWAALVYIAMPGVWLSSLLISTDPFLLCFWALALLAYVHALDSGKAGHWVLLGVAVGLGLLAKYAMVFFLASMFVHLAITRDYRGLLRQRGPWLATGVGVLIYLPNLWWNWANGFASYRHTGENANLSGSLFHFDELVEFLGSQFGVFGPFLFAVLLVILIARPRSTFGNPRLRLLMLFTVPVLAAITVQAFISRANANWAATAYVAASVLVAAWLVHRPRWAWVLKASLALHVVVGGLLYTVHDVADAVGWQMPKRLDLLSRVRGWDQVGGWVAGLAAQNPGATLLFHDRKVMATMLYYARPAADTAIMWNPQGHILNHYELTTTLNGHEGEDVLFITEHDGSIIRRWFQRVEDAGVFEVPLYPDYTLTVRAFRGVGFKGYDTPLMRGAPAEGQK